MLVNSKNQLPENFTHQIKEYQGIAVDERIIPALEKMMKDAGQDGCDLKLISGYVSSEDQEKKYQEKVDELTGQGLSRVRAEDQAQSTIGRGGYNEAQTGLSVCFATEQAQGAAFADTPEYTWLSTNSVKYGFVLRYPKNKVNVTNMEFDPSRFRYVGGENAAKMREYAMCLEAVSYTHLDVYKRQDQQLYKELMKEHKTITPIVEKYQEYQKTEQAMDEAKEMLAEGGMDREFKSMVEEEYEQAKSDLERLTDELKILLLPRDPNDDRNVIVEIRGGAGGEEAALFSAVLFRMYSMYAEQKGWKTEIMNVNETELGGYKEISFMISGDGAYSCLLYTSRCV